MEMKPCPFCGEIPRIESDFGTFIYIECCDISMSLQKCDYLNLEERETWNNNTYSYGKDAEAKVLSIIIDKWNTRA